VENREKSNLLVIAQDGSERVVLSRFLRGHGFAVKTVGGIEEVRTVCARWQPTLVVLVAGEAGGGFLKMLRELREPALGLAGVPVTLGRAKALDRAVEAAARDLGVTQVVLKPLENMDQLSLMIAKVIAGLGREVDEPQPEVESEPAEAERAVPSGGEAPAPGDERGPQGPSEPEEARAAAPAPPPGPEGVGPAPSSGSLADTSLAELVYAYHVAGAGGRLDLRRGTTATAIFFERGCPCHVESSAAEASLESFLERSGRLSKDQQLVVLEECKTSKMTQRRVILEKGLLSPHGLFEALSSKAREEIVECFGWEDGAYAFERGAVRGSDVAPIGLKVPALIKAGVERHYGRARLERLLATPDGARLRVLPTEGAKVRPDDLCLSTLEARLFELASHGATVGEICDAAGDRVVGLRFVYALTVMHVLALDAEAGAARPDGPVEAGPAKVAAAPTSGAKEPARPASSSAVAKEPARPAAAPKAGANEPARPASSSAAHGEEPIERLIERLAGADYFELFGLARDASTEDVHAAFRAKAARVSPEALILLPEATRAAGNAVYKRMVEAYRVLANPRQRADYLAHHPARRASPASAEAAGKGGPGTDRLGQVIAEVERALGDGHTDEALRVLRSARKDLGDNVRVLAWFGWVLYLESPELNVHEAERLLGRARSLAPEHPEPYLLMARLRVREGAPDRARELYRKALSLDPGAAAVARELAQLDAEGKPAAAPRHAEESTPGNLSKRGRELVGLLKRFPIGKKP
jgi:CheY-like chemotaxis protein/tetratricopeptide (TPR) repeat protein